jgi:hypothetical protein
MSPSLDLLLAATGDKLAIAESLHKRAVDVLIQLQDWYEDMRHDMEPEVEPDQEQPEVDGEKSLEFASLGIRLASQEKRVIRLEQDVVSQERMANMLDPKEANTYHLELLQSYLYAGEDLWKHQRKKAILDDSVTHVSTVSSGLIDLYRNPDRSYGCNDRFCGHRKLLLYWRQTVLAYYDAKIMHGLQWLGIWCHVVGARPSDNVRPVRIVPEIGSLGELLFGDKAESLDGAGNVLLLSEPIATWFESYQIAVVPVEPTQTPITRWRTDILSPDLMNKSYWGGKTGKDLDGRQLRFRSDKRPVARFLYFRFVMTLIRARDLEQEGWKEAWARYYNQQPFPAPEVYVRKSMLLALATHFETADMRLVESWITHHGFDSPLKLTDDQATEAARRVYVVVQADAVEAARRLGRDWKQDPETASQDGYYWVEKPGEREKDDLAGHHPAG